MKAFNGKPIIAIILMMCLNIGISMAQTGTTKHIVDRGETLESIAKKYGTTPEKIIELNPDAGQFVYVGMELEIPATGAVQTNTNEESLSQEKNVEQQTIVSENYNSTLSDRYDGWSESFSLGWGFIPKPKGAKGTSLTYAINIGANYNITESFYVGARIGYTGLFTTYGLNNERTSHLISVPTEVGYRWFLSDKIALVPYAGFDFNLVVKCKEKQKIGSKEIKRTIKPDNRLGVNGRIGLKINIKGYTVGVSYILSMDKNFGKNDGYPEIAVGIDI